MKVNKLWSCLGLTPRIGIVIVLTLVATQVLDQVLITLVPPPNIFFYTQEWLAEQAAIAARAASAVSPSKRAAALAAMNSDWLTFSLRPTAPRAGQDDQTPDRLKQAVARQLAGNYAHFVVRAEPLNGPPDRASKAVAVILTQLPTVLVNAFKDEFEEGVIITGSVEVSVELDDGSWLSMSNAPGEVSGIQRVRNVLVLFGGLALIAGISLIAARGIIRPLEKLASAADRLGRERQATSIPASGVPEFDAIGRSFNDMQQRLKRFVDDRTQLLAAISHDLRTPLTRLRLFAESVEDELHRRQVLNDIAEMESMIAATLVFASDEVRREIHSRVDLAALLISLCDVVSDAGATANYEGPDHAELPCQPVAMRRALANLVDNACKYGERADVILRDQAEAIEITIADRGPAIPGDQVERAFAPFQRLEASRNRSSGGTGLGLTIARDVIHGHGGQIALEANTPAGLLVRIHLPKPNHQSRLVS